MVSEAFFMIAAIVVSDLVAVAVAIVAVALAVVAAGCF